MLSASVCDYMPAQQTRHGESHDAAKVSHQQHGGQRHSRAQFTHEEARRGRAREAGT